MGEPIDQTLPISNTTNSPSQFKFRNLLTPLAYVSALANGLYRGRAAAEASGDPKIGELILDIDPKTSNGLMYLNVLTTIANAANQRHEDGRISGRILRDVAGSFVTYQGAKGLSSYGLRGTRFGNGDRILGMFGAKRINPGEKIDWEGNEGRKIIEKIQEDYDKADEDSPEEERLDRIRKVIYAFRDKATSEK